MPTPCSLPSLMPTDLPGALSRPVREAAGRSVLCWLATVDAQGMPNVSPKEIWTFVGERHVVVANIASPTSVRNIVRQPQVCLSFIDVFVQKGYKLQGQAREVRADAPDFAHWAAPLQALAGERFPIRSVLVIEVQSAVPILAPSYALYPDTTTEAAQVASAMRAYGVQTRNP